MDPSGERWSRGQDGTPLRYVSSVSGLFDCSIVVEGAYSNTDVAAAERSYKEQGGSAVPPPDYFHKMYEEYLKIAQK